MMDRSISITGMGIVCAIGNDAASVLDSLRRKESGIRQMKYLESLHSDIPVGEVQLSTEQMAEMLGLKGEEPVSRTSVMGAIAVREALNQAKVKDLDKKKVVLISGTTVGVMDVTEKFFERMKNEPDLQYLPHSNECGKSTLQIARYAGVPNAECCTISTACSSALNALILGSEMLGRGDADVVIAGGSESLSKFHLNGFNTLMILDRERCRPFDDTRAGLNLGEGAAYVVLERNAPNPLAYVKGYANRCDAFHQTATSENGDGAFLAMSAALANSGLSVHDIQYVNAHGTGTPDNDSSESRALQRVFGDSLPEISSTKSYTGHTTSASGSIETVICILALLNNFIPASLGWSKAMPGGVVPTPGRTDIRMDNVMCNSFGFGGNDSSVILGREPSSAGRCERFDFTGVSTVSHIVVKSDDGNLSDLKEFVPPMESRRMCKLMKAGLLSAMRAMKTAGVACPDAIVSATSRGMLETSTLFLEDVVTNREELLKPTLFMQSTHNTVSSAIAIRTGCHGYNITYSQGDDSLKWAMRDAERLIRSGEAKVVLVCSFDEDVQNLSTTEYRAESFILKSED